MAAAEHRSGLVLGQEAVEHKSNEIPTVRTLVTGLNLQGRVVTLDAMHTQDETARCLVEQCSAHYVMTAVKDNRPELLRDLAELAIARADGRYPKLLASIAKTEVLVIDDWGLAKLNAENRRDLLEIIEDRHGIRSTVATSQLPLEKWHDVVGDPTLADAILDRLVHSAYQLNLKGESMRKRRPALTQTNHRGS